MVAVGPGKDYYAESIDITLGHLQQNPQSLD